MDIIKKTIRLGEVQAISDNIKFNFLDDVNVDGRLTANEITMTDDTVSNNTCDIHIARTGDACLLMEADINGDNDSEHPFIFLTQDANNTAFRIAGNGVSPENKLTFDCHSTDVPSTGFLFRTGDLINNGIGSIPTFTSTTNKFSITNTVTDHFQDVNFNSNDVSGIDDLEVLGQITAPMLIQDNTLTEYVVYDGDLKTKTQPYDFITYAFDNTQSATTSNTFQQKLAVTSPVLPAGDYRVVWYCKTANLSGVPGNYTEVEFAVPSVGFSFVTSGRTDTIGMDHSHAQIVTLGGGIAITPAINWREVSGGTALINNAVITIERVA